MRAIFLAIFLFLSIMPAFANEDYICPMHPFVHGRKGDHCPICGMELALTAPEKEQNQSLPIGTIDISPAYIQALGVRTDKVTYHDFGQSVQSFGRIIPNTRDAYQISLRKGGWIKDLRTSAIGDSVNKGAVLFTLYSPDIINVETEYLTGLKTGFRAGASEARLRLYGMDEQAIAEFKKRGAIIEEVPFHAPADGVVTFLNVLKGGYVAEGMPVLTLQDFSKVWVEAHVQIKDLNLLKIGTPAAVTVAQTGEKYRATVDFIYPMADSDSREGMVRLVLDNPEGMLKTDQLVDVMFTANAMSRLAAPEQAVMRSGMGSYVLKDLGKGHFLPVMVKTAITADGFTEITSGLSEGQYIVTSGQFMLDAESNLQGGMADMPGMDMGNTPMPQDDGMKGMDMGNGHGK